MNILYVENNPKERKLLTNFLKKYKYSVIEAPRPEPVLDLIRHESIDLIISDYLMYDMNGYQFLEKVKNINPLIPFIMITAYGDIEVAVNAMKEGATDYIEKPVNYKVLLEKIKIIEAELQVKKEYYTTEQKKPEPNEKDKKNPPDYIYKSKKMINVISKIPRIAKIDLPVLIVGETGTGKEATADMIQSLSDRKDKIFIKINCAAIPDSLIESELFGFEKGSFTGATSNKKGKIEQANGGTIFLDEIGEVPYNLQGKLLRFFQNYEIQKVGSNKSIKVDVRIICSTNRNLVEQINKNEFREDLYFRINAITLEIPPLRERKEDIPLLIDYFKNKLAKEKQIELKDISQEALNKLMNYDYPGNVRELKNIVQNALIFSLNGTIKQEDITLQKNFKIKSSYKLNEKDKPKTIPDNVFDTNESDLVEVFIKNLIDDLKNLQKNVHYRIIDKKLYLNITDYIKNLEMDNKFYNRKKLLNKLKKTEYLLTNKGQIYLNNKNHRCWVFDIIKIKEKFEVNIK